jgi:hypothetical protein
MNLLMIQEILKISPHPKNKFKINAKYRSLYSD